ncbi:MAG: glycosyltransferase [Nocardioides sp.]|nr:glycosyltransferase [Nocardioides sp.]
MHDPAKDPASQSKVDTLIEITIPVLDEATSLRANITHLRSYLDRELADLAPIGVVVADNGSTDRTLEIAEELAATLSHVRALSVGERGVGRALKASWGSSAADVVGYMDLDFSTDLSYLRPALDALATGDTALVNGSRLAHGASAVGRSLVRELSSRVFNWLVKTYFGTSFTDGMCGFKFLRREFLPGILEAGAASDGWFFATELLVAAESCGLTIVEIPVVWTDDGNSKVKIARLSVEYLRDMRRLKRRLESRR